MLFSRVEYRLITKTIKLFKTNYTNNSSKVLNVFGKRLYLTDAYKCKEAWDQRLKNHLISKINMDDYFVEITRKFTAKKKVSCVDVDLFACSITNAEHFEELENLLYRFRRSKQTINTLESTYYAVVSLFLSHGKLDRLLKILNDKVNYGVFPSHLSFNLILDEFLKQENYQDAAKISVLMMLQEDFGNPISQILALHSCLSYLKDPKPESWEAIDEESVKVEQGDAEADEDEIVYVRIPYLRNPYFDDHFDLKEPKHLVGKTLYLVGKEFPDAVGRSSQLIGLGLYQKWEKSSQLINSFLNLKETPVLLEDAINKFTSELLSSEVNEDLKESLQANLTKLQSSGLISKDSLDERVQEKLKEIPQLEKTDIECQHKLFVEWEKVREQALEIELEKLRRKERLAFIKEKKKELLEKEQLLFFFENWKKHEMELEEIKLEEKQFTSHEVEEYVPPEVNRNHN